MANDALSFRELKLGLPQWAIEAAFAALLLLAFVGLTPFSPPPQVAEFGGAVQTGAGDTLRQICYLAVFALLALGAVQKRGSAAASVVPLLLALLLAWAALSALWAAAPGIAFRRAGLEIVLVLSVFLGVDAVGVERSLVIWRWLLAAVLVVNIVSIPLVHTAVHNPGENDPGLVGDWRGLYGHKNIAGAVTALTAILFLFPAVDPPALKLRRAGLGYESAEASAKAEHKSWRDGLVVLLALFFLVMTRSKSSLGLLPVALFAGAIYRVGWRRGLDRMIVVVTAAILAGALIAFLALDYNALARLLEDPTEFTGRAAIWQAELSYIFDHPLLGSGFGTFADTGGLSPLHDYVSNGDWVNAVSHGHSGYLQLFVTIGGVGFLLAFAALIVAPLIAFWRIDGEVLPFKAMLFSIFVFLVLHNVMESDFLEGDGSTWVAFLLMLAMLYETERSAGK
jgi:O-antigen ligase